MSSWKLVHRHRLASTLGMLRLLYNSCIRALLNFTDEKIVELLVLLQALIKQHFDRTPQLAAEH